MTTASPERAGFWSRPTVRSPTVLGACVAFLSSLLFALHGLTDPTTILVSGGMDTSVGAAPSGSSSAAALITTLLIVFGFVAVLFVRGRARVTTPEG